LKRLTDWARQRKRQGRFKHAFHVYNLWKQTERNIHVWWSRDATRVIYTWGVALRPNWENGHSSLGKAYKHRYEFLTTRVPWDEKELVAIGNRAVGHFRKALEVGLEALALVGELVALELAS
jgi:hypothetical protein